MTADAAPSAACAATTTPKAGADAMRTQPAATRRPEIATRSLFAFRASTRRPAGIWQTAAAMDEAAIATPIAPGSQCCEPLRKTER